MKRPNITPGPWQLSSDYNSGRKDGQRIAIICAPHPEGGGQNIAEAVQRDARAIAALPDLLSALEDTYAGLSALWAIHAHGAQNDTLEAAKAALIKAGYTFD